MGQWFSPGTPISSAIKLKSGQIALTSIYQLKPCFKTILEDRKQTGHFWKYKEEDIRI